MDAVRVNIWRPWSAEMLPELHRLFPSNLAMQSLGSYDHERKRASYRALCELPGNDVLQVHRYLDLGASWKNSRRFPHRLADVHAILGRTDPMTKPVQSLLPTTQHG
ncbi:MAG: hypothetical protein ACLQNE_26810 [Thermoguttaceae bacterium]